MEKEQGTTEKEQGTPEEKQETKPETRGQKLTKVWVSTAKTAVILMKVRTEMLWAMGICLEEPCFGKFGDLDDKLKELLTSTAVLNKEIAGLITKASKEKTK